MTTQVKTRSRTRKRKEFLHGVFTTALEGGIGYWSAASEYHWALAHKSDDDYERDDLDGFYAIVHELDENTGEYDGDVHRIDAEVIARGIGLFKKYALGKIDVRGKPSSKERPISEDHYWRQFLKADWTNGDEGDYDSNVADLIVQFGLFGQVVYG